MTIAEAVREHLLTLAPVTALVNSRIWTHRLPQKVTRPAVLVQEISNTQYPITRGTTDIQRGRIQIDCVADSIKVARALDQAVLGRFQSGAVTGLRGFAGSVAGSPGLDISSCQSDTVREWYEGDELSECRVTRDYLVWFKESL